MDESGDKPPRFDLWLKKMGIVSYEYNDRDIQSIASDVCGLYACYFAKHGLPENNRTAWSFLSKDVQANDERIRELVHIPKD